MKKTIIAVATLAAASLAQATDTTWTSQNKGNIYARFSVVHDFQGEVETTALNNTSRTVKDDLGGTWVEYGVGGNFRLSDTANVYVDLERTSGGEIQENWRWTIGARKVF